MKLTTKLLSFLHRVFDKDPAPFLALRLRCDGDGMTWSVSNARLSTTPVGGAGQPLSVDLTQFTLGELVNYLAAQPGYTVEFADYSELSLLGAVVLLDAQGDQNKSNGDHLRGYTSVLWSYMEANARELQDAAAQIDQMRRQMSTTTASGVWLDELGSYYGVPRLQGEPDASYGRRIIAEVLRPRGNNIAIEAAIRAYTGQETKVTDVVVNSGLEPLYNGSETHDGTRTYNAISSPVYGLFDVEYGYDILNNGDIAEFAQVIRDLIGRLRDAGTHLRSLSLTGSLLTEEIMPPADVDAMPIVVTAALEEEAAVPDEEMDTVRLFLSTLADAGKTGTEVLSMTATTNYRYGGLRRYDGKITHNGVGDMAEATS